MGAGLYFCCCKVLVLRPIRKQRTMYDTKHLCVRHASSAETLTENIIHQATYEQHQMQQSANPSRNISAVEAQKH